MGVPEELRERAVRMMLVHQHEYGSQREAMCSVAEKLGPKPETVRLWVRQAEKDTGRGPGAILRAAAHFFGAETSHPHKSQAARPEW